jgi:hypothetical protein
MTDVTNTTDEEVYGEESDDGEDVYGVESDEEFKFTNTTDEEFIQRISEGQMDGYWWIWRRNGLKFEWKRKERVMPCDMNPCKFDGDKIDMDDFCRSTTELYNTHSPVPIATAARLWDIDAPALNYANEFLRPIQEKREKLTRVWLKRTEHGIMNA